MLETWHEASPQWGPPNSRCYCTKFSCVGNLASRIWVPLDIFDKWPTWRTILFYVFIFIFNSLNVSSTSCSSSWETNCVNTTSGSCQWPCHVQVRPAHDTATERVTATRGGIDTISLSWWWAHCAQNMHRVINKNKHVEKNCVSCWSFTKNHYMMHSQQNIK